MRHISMEYISSGSVLESSEIALEQNGPWRYSSVPAAPKPSSLARRLARFCSDDIKHVPVFRLPGSGLTVTFLFIQVKDLKFAQ